VLGWRRKFRLKVAIREIEFPHQITPISTTWGYSFWYSHPQRNPSANSDLFLPPLPTFRKDDRNQLPTCTLSSKDATNMGR
jgi:hypothetical protein